MRRTDAADEDCAQLAVQVLVQAAEPARRHMHLVRQEGGQQHVLLLFQQVPSHVRLQVCQLKEKSLNWPRHRTNQRQHQHMSVENRNSHTFKIEV